MNEAGVPEPDTWGDADRPGLTLTAAMVIFNVGPESCFALPDTVDPNWIYCEVAFDGGGFAVEVDPKDASRVKLHFGKVLTKGNDTHVSITDGPHPYSITSNNKLADNRLVLADPKVDRITIEFVDAPPQ